MGVGPKIGVILTTQIIHFNRVFHEINHPFWGPTRNFWKHPHTSPLPKCPVVTKGGFLGRPRSRVFFVIVEHRWASGPHSRGQNGALGYGSSARRRGWDERVARGSVNQKKRAIPEKNKSMAM